MAIPHEMVSILMVEDDTLDYESFKRSLKKSSIANPLFHAVDGVQALEMLRGQLEVKLGKPLIVLMDINMPRMNGIECLKAIRQDEELKDTVVFVMTTSNDEQDIYDAYNLNVAGYMVKSELGTSFLKTINMLDSYFNAIVLLGEHNKSSR